ncbi:hypothetical protein [Stenotrophomonas sp. NPDC078853]|uniref:hypothetical protein n=1 Tax=Stenotrophomonas sp. NPDC078853 TaxID=3364534 RepID=UPI00384E2C00
MKDTIKLTISGQKFTLTRAEAEFIAQHLRTAVAQPDLGLHFAHARAEHSGQIVLSRGTVDTQTDC